jgi:acyl dehydratase
VKSAHDGLEVGHEIPELILPPLERRTLAAYADASGDHALVHLDSENARSFGFPDVIAHGLLVMAYLGRVVTSWTQPRNLKSFSARFTNTVNIGDQLTCRGKISHIERRSDGKSIITLDLIAADQTGVEKIRGKAVVSLQ